MELSHLYAGKLRTALKGSVDTRKVAEAWAALHPKEFGAVKALDPVLSTFLARWAAVIRDAIKSVLGNLWPESWVLGQQAAEALAADLPAVDWAGWTPGDVEAAFQVAGPGLRDLLASQDVTIKSITGSRLEELGNVLAQYMSSDAVGREPLPAPLEPEYSVDALADALEGVLDNPDMAYMVAQTEVARASSIAAQEVFRQLGIGQVQVSSAGDKRVCPRCAAAEAAGAQPMGTYTVPLHPLCRCALIPVIPVGTALAALGGVMS